MPNYITKKALDALEVSPEIFISVAKNVLECVSNANLGLVPVFFGHTEETKRIVGNIYVIPSSKKRLAFALLWDTEPRKYLYPNLFQALDGPNWAKSFDATFDNSGTVNLSETLLSESADTSLPDLIDAYLAQRLDGQGSKTLLLYRPVFTSIDRFQTAFIDKSDDVALTNFMKEIYGFFPQMDQPLLTAIKATDGLGDSHGLLQVKTASSKMVYKYVAAEKVSEAKKKTRLYSSYATASDYAPEKEWPIYRVALDEDGLPKWSTLREVHSAADDLSSKTASARPEWFDTMVDVESRRMATRLRSAISTPGQKVIL